MTIVFDATAIDATDDGAGDANVEWRSVISAAALSAASGNQVSVSFKAGTGAQGAGTPTLSGAWIGQAASAGSISFSGNQVQLKFGGSNTFNITSSGQVITSDVVTLGENFDNTKDYLVSFRRDNASTGSTTLGTINNVNSHFLTSSPAGDEALTSSATPAGFSPQANTGQFVRQIFITGGAASGPSKPSSRTMVPSLGPTRGLQAVRAFPGAIIASGTWSSTGAANDAIWSGQSVGPPLALPVTQRILRPNIGPSRGLQQVKGFPPPAAAISSATWSSAGAANDAIWTGAAIDAATWSSVGSGAANWTGAATGAATWSSAGAANDAIWVGTGVLGGVWSAAGVGAATWVGLGISIQSGVWASAGTSDAPWIGASIFAGVWSASGVGSANWTGGATAASTWASTGTGAASWTGAATAAGTWGSSGISDAPWVGAVPATQGALSSDGVGLAFWIGADATPSAAKPGGAGYVHSFSRKRWRELKEELERELQEALAIAQEKGAKRVELIEEQERSGPVKGILGELSGLDVGVLSALAGTSSGILPDPGEPASDGPPEWYDFQTLEVHQFVRAAASSLKAAASATRLTTAIKRINDARQFAGRAIEALRAEEAEEEEAEMLLFFQ